MEVGWTISDQLPAKKICYNAPNLKIILKTEDPQKIIIPTPNLAAIKYNGHKRYHSAPSWG